MIDRFRALPMSRSAVLAGRRLADLLRNAAVLSLMFVVGFTIGFRFQTSLSKFLSAFGLGAVRLVAVVVMATIGLLVRNPEATQTRSSFLSCCSCSRRRCSCRPCTMPDWLRVFADYQPVTVISNALRVLMPDEEALLAGQTVAGQVVISLVWIVGIAAVFSLLAVHMYPASSAERGASETPGRGPASRRAFRPPARADERLRPRSHGAAIAREYGSPRIRGGGA